MLSNCLSDTRWAPTIVLQYAPAHEATPPPTKPLSALCLRVEVCRDSWDCIQKLPVCGAARGWWVSAAAERLIEWAPHRPFRYANRSARFVGQHQIACRP